MLSHDPDAFVQMIRERVGSGADTVEGWPELLSQTLLIRAWRGGAVVTSQVSFETVNRVGSWPMIADVIAIDLTTNLDEVHAERAHAN